MAAYYMYGAEHFLPYVDHAHQRTHQHRNLVQYLAHLKPHPEDHPNQPDVDLRDGLHEFLIEVEVPGVKDVHELSVHWTTSRSLIISGDVSRPDEPTTTGPSTTGDGGEKGETQDGAEAKDKPHKPVLLIGERRIGPFRRIVTFPDEVETDKVTAHLEAGLLKIRVPKKDPIPVVNRKVDVKI
ncbi:hypothetical protein M8818_001870 [Zalaria obscura]|uniref:Uncharacterized protein n=1 Tax=Zalaria obscura TaxID=2024903 RepID=A0ACC3SLK7_9PEZI